MDCESGIPILDFRKRNGVMLEEGSQGWKEMSKKVREVFESHGVFLLRCDEISNKLQKEMFTSMKSLFELPEETKLKFSGSRIARGYIGKSPSIPHSQSFGIEAAYKLDTAQNFTNLMWSEGNPTFCETLLSFSSKARELSSLILKMIVEGFGLPEKYILEVEEIISDNDSRLTRYQLPENNDDAVTFVPHTDKGAITLICENEVQGLQVLQKSGNWVNVNIPQNGFVVIVGDILKSWSNGRFKAPIHRVVLKENKERFVYVLFSLPNEEALIKIPSELIDEKDHPLRYKLFKYKEYMNYIKKVGTKDGALEEFAGL